MNIPEAEVLWALQELDVPPSGLEAPLQEPRPDVAARLLEEFKQRVKAAFRRAALRLHPDRGGDAEAFKRCSAVVDFVESLQLLPRQPPRPVIRQTVVVFFTGSSGNSTTSTGSWGGGWTTF